MNQQGPLHNKKQDIFNRACEHLIKQGRKSHCVFDGKNLCAYHGADGAKCALGCLIPDDVYSPSMENKGVHKLIADYSIPGFNEANQRLLTDLQVIHDYMTVKEWRKALRFVASEYGLTVPAVLRNAH